MTPVPIDQADYSAVPDDYPSASISGAVSGEQAKLLLTSGTDGKFYRPGAAPEIRWHDWKYSSYLASVMAEKCVQSKAGKLSNLSESEIILQYFQRAIEAAPRYGTEEQLKWTFTKVAERLGWTLPDICRREYRDEQERL